ncbi:Transmembrane protein 42 [Coemansia sp. RSA 2702]|nr:Transmembrane protein 42 [Coemansia sp. RSA 2705]KAJ2321609.1 Transmembrane protein 42 [Coemansia sp. RSA 2702]
MPEILPDRRSPAARRSVLAPSSFFAVLGGVFAALGSASAKLTVGAPSAHVGALAQALAPGLPAAATARALAGGLAALSNVLMWLFFTKALRYGQSTARVMMLQTAGNFAATAACGVYVFGDRLALQWWAGAALIAAGLVLVNTKAAPEGPQVPKRD